MHEAPIGHRIGQQIHHAVVLHCQRVGYFARHAIRQDLSQILISTQWSVCIVIAFRRFAEATIEISDDGGCIRVGGLPCGGAFDFYALFRLDAFKPGKALPCSPKK